LSTQEPLLLEDWSFDDASDTAAAMALPGVRHYLAKDCRGQDTDLGLHALVEHPEALSWSFRDQLQ
jgi:hypothetical protein